MFYLDLDRPRAFAVGATDTSIMGLVGQLLSLPYIALFFLSWVVSSIAGPIKHISLLFLIAQPNKTIYKLKLFCLTFLYLLCCNDKKWKAPKEDPASYFPADASVASASKIQKKTIVFVRHGESTWNDT